MKKFIFTSILLFFAFSALTAQENAEVGYPLIKNYSPKEYEADPTNWAIIQDKRGIMNFGNFGVLEYDGFDWRLNILPNNSVVRCFGINKYGTLYIGGVGDFGYFQTDSIGKNKFVSLLKQAPEKYRRIADVWNLYVDGDNVYFSTDTYVFRWSTKNKKMKIWKADNNFHVSFFVNGKFYIREWNKGLLVLENDSLKLIPSSKQFADERIYVMLAMPNNPKNILVVTRTKGLFLFDGKVFVPFKTEADEFIKKNLIYMPGLVLNDGNIALGTLTGGIIIISPKGKILNIYNSNSGLSGNTIYYLYQDKAGTIWAAQDGGISKIDYGSSATYFDARKGLTQKPLDMKRFKGIIYEATNSGIYYLNPKTSLFQIVKNTPNTQCFGLTIFCNRLIAGTNEGVYEIRNDKMFPIRKSVNKDYEVGFLLPSKVNPNRLFTGINGVGSLLLKNGKWIDEGNILKINGNTTGIVETMEGDLWAGNTVNGVYKINFLKDDDGRVIVEKPNVEFFDEKNGLPNGSNGVVKILGKNYFGVSEGIYRFDKNKKQFFRDDSSFSFVHLKNNSYTAFFAFEDSSKRVWVSGGLEPALGIPKKDGKYDWITEPFKRFSNESIQNIYPDKNNVVWFFINQGLIRYDLDFYRHKPKKYDAFVRTATVGEDSIIYYGNTAEQRIIPKISYDNNSIKFRYSAASYEDEEGIEFKLFLDGFDKNWSNWSHENIKEYTNLSPGKYSFKVKAKNILSMESNEASFSFIILSPWYRTWWAYIFYLLSFGLLIFAIDRFQRNRVTLKERQRSRLREIELRAEAAEADAKALQIENERKKNVELLSEIGRNITANLSIEQIIDTVYENVNSLMDASVFGIGLYNSELNRLDFPALREKGVKLPNFFYLLSDENRPASWCFNNQKEILSNDYQKDYKKYIKERKETAAGDRTESVIYLPLTYKDKKIGVITAQSFKKNSYTDYHLNILKNLATYTSIAIDNADAYKQLNETVIELDKAINDLKSTQEKLIVQQKLASLGQLTAGIAHEIKNPLNFVNNFAEVSVELVGELKEEINKLKNKIPGHSSDSMLEIIKDLEENSNRINQHGKRADGIVKSMLQHSRGKAGERQESDINAILDEDINLAYHGMRARDSSFNIAIEKKFDENLNKISIVPQDVSRVFLNIIQNGFYETNKKKTQNGNNYSPKILIQTMDDDKYIKIKIRDNGNGIPLDAQDKLFNPFFTTKPSGEGTGLGLSLSHDIIVKQHGGDIKFETESGKFTEFIITLPKNGN